MSLYHLFHGQAIPFLWVPAKVCENRHCEYKFNKPSNNGSNIEKHNHMLYFSKCLCMDSFCHLAFLLIIFKYLFV